MRDTSDTHKIIKFLLSKNPFDNDVSLHSIDTGVIASDSVNVDVVCSVGQKILDDMIGHNVLEYVFKKKSQVVTLEARTSVQTGKESISIDPLLLFQQLVTVGKQDNDLCEVFKHELCSYPPSLFETTNVLLAPNKSTLADAMWKQLPSDSSDLSSVPKDVQYVLDGGALLHRISWKVGETYDEICCHYIHYVTSKYKQAIIVFDGYESGPSTKDVMHERRSKSNISVAVHFTSDMTCSMKKDEFLSNKVNKQRFINLLSEMLEKHGHQTLHARADADVLMVETAIASAAKRDTVLVGDDTDLLVLLCNQASETVHQIYFRPEPKSNTKKLPRCWNIKFVQEVFGEQICENLLFAHAILGCDTTSKIFGIGKPTALKKLKSSEYFRKQAAVFRNEKAKKCDIIHAGENALVCLYNGKPGEKLDTLRLEHFYQKVSSCTSFVQPHTLPPTSSSAKYHSLHVYHQVQQWNGIDMKAEEWGWKVCDGKMLPLQTDLKPAPDYLLEAIKCNCKTDCGTRRCTCRKYGLDCSPACGECKGLHCSNAILPDPESDSDDIS